MVALHKESLKENNEANNKQEKLSLFFTHDAHLGDFEQTDIYFFKMNF